MQISLGFVLILVLILFPGLIFRRLYFFGEFSKQFSSNQNLIRVISISSVPGIINLVFVFIFYDYFILPIDLGIVIDKFKDIVSPNFRSSVVHDEPIKELLKNRVSPFIYFLYLSAIIFGGISGRLIRITRLDTKSKLLRFNNYWFYLFNGQHTSFKKMRHLQPKNRVHVFTKVDILIESNNKTHLYSGIIVDYELKHDDSDTLSKIMLQNAVRYTKKDNKRMPVSIPGSIFVVDCSGLKNINLTFISKEKEHKDILQSKLPILIDYLFSLCIIFLLPILFFQVDIIEYKFYNDFFDYTWYKKVIVYLFLTQVLYTIVPFTRKNGKYEYVNSKQIKIKLVLILVLGGILFFI